MGILTKNGKPVIADGSIVEMDIQEGKTVIPGTSNQTAVASGMFTSGDVIVKGDTNLKAENIKQGVSIFGISGTVSAGIDTSDATATASDIAEGKTAYVNGTKVTGTMQPSSGGLVWVDPD